MRDFATDKNRWWALVFLAIGLAIVIIDNTVLNVAIPYILRDFKTPFESIQWVISGYALIIATLLITVGRLGDLFGRKKIFLLGTIFFAIGSLIASFAPNVTVLFVGEAIVEALGDAAMLTSSLSLLASEFQGKERSIAFGIWGSVAGAAASIGPLLGGYLTTYFSWRWSLRINVFVALVAILGSVFIKESKGEGQRKFDVLGMILSGLGLFCLIFSVIEGTKYGWLTPNESFSLGLFSWPLPFISVIPFFFALSGILLSLFVLTEILLEARGQSPTLRLSMFKDKGFSIGLITLIIISLGQFGVFFILPIYLQNTLHLTALQTGVIFLWTSVMVSIFGPLSGFLASKVGPKWLTSIGMFILSLGTLLLRITISPTATGLILAPSLIIFGIGIGMTGAQLTNIILSGVDVKLSGEASAINTTFRQIGTSIGIAVLGVILTTSLSNHLSLADSSKNAMTFALVVIFIGALVSLLIPNHKTLTREDRQAENQA